MQKVVGSSPIIRSFAPVPWRVIIVAALAAFLGSLLVSAAQGESSPRGRFRVGAVTIYLHCTGAGSPTVVFDSGLANDHTYWRGIEAASTIATRRCSWDRPGWGMSQRHAGDRLSVDAIVHDLNGVLRAAGVRGPFVLVGHSLGGLDLQAYAQRHPADVAGLVLVDSTSPFAFPRYAATFGVNGFTLDVSEAARRLRKHPLRLNVPLVVLEHGVYDRGLDPGGWHAYQRGLTRISTAGILVRATTSGHDIPIDQPKLTTAVIESVVTAVRTGTRVRCATLRRVGGACA